MSRVEIHGICDARFLRLRDVFAEQLENPGEGSASVAVTAIDRARRR